MEHAGVFAPGQQRVAGFAAIDLKIHHRGAIGGEHPQPVAGRHPAQRAICPQYRQWASHAFYVEDHFAHPGILDPIGPLEQECAQRDSRVMASIRFGIDLGGTKIEILALDPGGQEILRRRVATPNIGGAAQYKATIRAIVALVEDSERELGARGSVGVGIPGIISPATGLVKNANSIALNGHPFDRDLSAALAREVRIENDANCFALSEAADGAGEGARVVFGVILGTGVGGGIVVDGKLVPGKHRVAGEWGHNPLPWAEAFEHPGPQCWCGRRGCIEALISGPALARDAGVDDASVLPGLAAAGEAAAQGALDRHASRLARSLAQVVNFLDPDVIVLGGGLSNLPHLPGVLPELVKPFVFSDLCAPEIRRARHGDSSGVRGAAWLWGSA